MIIIFEFIVVVLTVASKTRSDTTRDPWGSGQIEIHVIIKYSAECEAQTYIYARILQVRMFEGARRVFSAGFRSSAAEGPAGGATFENDSEQPWSEMFFFSSPVSSSSSYY